jgi:hypothetical protein
LITHSPQFGRTLTVEEGSMVLRDVSGVVADSLNYGGLVDPWAAEGNQATSGALLSGCYVPAPGSAFEAWSTVMAPIPINTSAGRFPDGVDTDSNCTDFLSQAAATLSATSASGATNIKVSNVEGFRAGQKILVDSGLNLETAVIAAVGTAGATTIRNATDVGATVLPAINVTGFSKGQTITIGSGANSETAVVSSVRARGAATITVATPLSHLHAAGVQITGTGISLASSLIRSHADGAPVTNNVPTPGGPNQYQKSNHRTRHGEAI